ncbi:3-hydroxybutyryl-CoA dehydrogenase [Chromobacterium sp. ATCC 53434]|uniref:3-hydroxybutyryl-CoA dehydrogenase n=1 Tax=Chromobacterium sp. (strain ATCC 53434 / SC 14030) TaxID=2059672 RepID=UPI000C78EFE0|nr:3-hydroxybutyryl-CoA dehydrogenase [Chromobacterium sp. ATCC 53434]AUH51515.1 3-hydroxybutyryl-CoA dehydrogenase [Chromobacterium sp. ATCC 53434]
MSQKIGVVGAGTMGNGIAQVFAMKGFEVVLADVSDAALVKGMANIQTSLQRMAKKELIAEGNIDGIVAHIRTTTALSDLAGCDVVIEAATENAEIKEKIFRELDAAVGEQCVLTSNTSSISLTRIASWVSHPERVVGMHFMNPVPVMQLVEIIRALQTGDEAYNTVFHLSEALGKTPVTVKDSAGFVSNRVLMPMINEAAFALYENLATAEDIDTVMKLGMNHPIGPLALADLIGLDTCLSVMDILYREFRDSKYRACPLLVQLVQAGHLGRKSGNGFYSYN